MYRIVFIADIHVGGEHRWGVSADRWDAPFREAMTWAFENHADMAVLAGDTFDKRNPTTEEWLRFQDIALSGPTGPIVNITGNHDVGVSSESVPTTEISSDIARDVHPVDCVNIFELDDESPQLVCLPWPRPVDYIDSSGMSLDESLVATRTAVMNCLRRTCADLDPNRPAILTGHAAVSYGATTPDGPGFMAGKDVILPYKELCDLPNIDLVLLGHIHDSEAEGYIGSTQPTDIADTGPKSFTVVEWEQGGELTTYTVPYTTSLKVARYEWDNELPGVESIGKADIIRINVNVPSDSTLTEEQVRSAYGHLASDRLIVQIKREVIERVRVAEDTVVAQLPPAEAFDTWLDVNEVEAAQRSRVRDKFAEVM